MTTPVIDLFAGAGGFLQAVQLAGAEPALSVEVDATCCQTLRANSPAGDEGVLEVM